MDRAIQATIEYTSQRKAFGKSILDNQYVHYRLAELQTEVECLRALLYQVRYHKAVITQIKLVSNDEVVLWRVVTSMKYACRLRTPIK